eukprot:TRINITY_DN73902_c0_g1_i1.p1 TRINITY_DN73902_c0_g1~~TRINITY_DN73902_c0_g1_i1.p1  ORF type:complete len:538 (+),score=89.71 TRINITY_DN73902_c0_g1_i1:63-1676(+)
MRFGFAFCVVSPSISALNALVAEPLAITFTGAPEFANPVVPDCSLGWYFDTGMLFANIGGTVRGYGSNQQAHILVNGSDINSYVNKAGGLDTNLCSSSGCNYVKAHVDWEGSYDDCGAWLNSVVVEDNNLTVHGFYHSEAMCNYSGDFTNKTMSYAVSKDGGLTWSKPGHPKNVILRSPSGNISCSHCTNEGDATVVRHGQWLYMHFMDWNGVNGDGSFSAGVSRSHISDVGLPAAWRKYWQGSWSEPSDGGQATAIANITGSHVYLLQEEDTAVCLGYRQTPLAPTSPTLSWSRDHLEWRQSPEPLWTPLMGEGTYDYPGLTGLRGSQDLRLGETWFEYGTYYPPTDTSLEWCTILFRHPIQTFRAGAAGGSSAKAFQALSLYVNTDKNDTWASTGLLAAMPQVSAGYIRQVDTLAWLMTTNRSDATKNAIALQDCRHSGRHFVAVSICPSSKSFAFSRTLGFVWSSEAEAEAASPDLDAQARMTPEAIWQCGRGDDLVLEVGANACSFASASAPATLLGFGYRLQTAAEMPSIFV